MTPEHRAEAIRLANVLTDVSTAKRSLRDEMDAAADLLRALLDAPAHDPKDAERYRWLRDTNNNLAIRSNTEHLEPLQVPVIYIGHPVEHWTLGAFASAPCGQSFDVAIDAAMAAGVPT